MPLSINHLYRFGEFTLDTSQRVLLRDGKPVALTPKVFDTLLILIDNKGRIVTKDEMMNRLWPDTFVEQTNLSFNIKQLRKTLGDDARNPAYIETISRRGYRFIARVEEVSSDENPACHQNKRLWSFFMRPSYSAAGVSSELATKPIESTPSLLIEKKAASAGESIDARSGLHGDATGLRKSTIVFRAALVTALAAAFVIFWKLSSNSAMNGGERAKAGDNALAASPLKFERLTMSGQSGLVAISPDGKYIAYTRHFCQKSSIWLTQPATNANVEVVPAGGAIYGMAIANGGESA